MVERASFSSLVEAWREGEWTVDVRLRGTTFGTEAQARATAQRWHELVQVAAQRDVELLEVTVRRPGAPDCETCEGRGVVGLVAPLDPCPDCVGSPYARVESRGYFVLCCVACDACADGGQVSPLPFDTSELREAWAREHVKVPGHDELVLVDPDGTRTRSTLTPDDVYGAWAGTVAYEGVETTDGRVLQRLSWPRLVLGPLPVVELGTGRPVGTITEVWREDFVDGEHVPAEGAVRVRARGTVLASVVGPTGRVALGVDVTGGQVESDGQRVVLVDGKLLGLTVYPEGSGSTPAWPDAALQLEEMET